MSFPQECSIQVPLRGPCENTLHLEWQGWPLARVLAPCLSLGAPSALGTRVPALDGGGYGGVNVPTRVSPHAPGVWGVPSSPYLPPGSQLSRRVRRQGERGADGTICPEEERSPTVLMDSFLGGGHKALDREGMGVPGPGDAGQRSPQGSFLTWV